MGLWAVKESRYQLERGLSSTTMASQMWLSAVLGDYGSGENGQPKGEGEGVMTLVEVPEGPGPEMLGGLSHVRYLAAHKASLGVVLGGLVSLKFATSPCCGQPERCWVLEELGV